MGFDTLVETLAVQLSQVSGLGEHATLDSGPVVARKVDMPAAREILSGLVARALENGLTLDDSVVKTADLKGGNTALQVSLASAQVDFVFKKSGDAKLIREARVIDDLRMDKRLGTFCTRLPKIYAQRSDFPYAYLMEWFNSNTYPSIEEIFFGDSENLPSAGHAADIVSNALDALSEAYVGSRDDRLQVRMMGEAYYDRIAKSLAEAAKQQEVFRPLPLRVNGQKVRSWQECLNVMESRQADLQSLAPPFVTVVHGDPNPGNILVKRSGPAIREVKFIDLKDWKFGDYLFDIAKLSHFLLHTGPIERLSGFDHDSAHVTSTEAAFAFERTLFPHVEAAVRRITQKTAEIADSLRDPHWSLRYELAMASNLLGLIPRRLALGRAREAQILYAEGMLILDRFIASWSAVGGGL